MEDKLIINYPTIWEYKIFLDKNCDEKSLIKEILNDRKYELNFSKNSSNSKFKSFNLNVEVFSNEERLELFSLLKHRCKFVL